VPSAPEDEPQGSPAMPPHADERATYLFGLVPVAAPVPDVPTPFPGAGPVRAVDVGEVRAVVCDVAPAAFRRLDDPGRDDLELLAATAFGHDDLLATLGRSGPVLPLRLGTVLRDDDALRGLLSAHGATLRDELHRLEGHAEWAVTVHLVEDASPDVDGRDGAAPPASGRDYLQARKQDLDRRATRRNVRAEIATLVHDRLATLAPTRPWWGRVRWRTGRRRSSTGSTCWRTSGGTASRLRSTSSVPPTRTRPSRSAALARLPLHRRRARCGRPGLDVSGPELGSSATGQVILPRGTGDATLVDLLDRVIDRGVVLQGDLVLTVAGIDLVHVSLQLTLKGIDGDELP
jgi:hypothetical protein